MDIDRDDEGLVLQDDELRLRTARLPADARLAQAWYSDPEVMHYSEGDTEARYDIAMIESMYQYLASQGELYIVELHNGGQWEPIGDATLAPKTVPIVIGVGKFRSRGYGKRILRLFVERARALGWRQLKVKKVFTYNLRARRLFESLGFEQEGDAFDEQGVPCWRYVKQL